MTEKFKVLSTEKWLERLIKEINDRENYHIMDYGKLKKPLEIGSGTALQYNAVAGINGRSENVVVLAQQEQNKVIVIRNFIQDCDSILGLFDAVRMLDAGKMQSESFVNEMDYADSVAYFPEYVSAKEYHFGADWKFKEIFISVRNPIGWVSYGKYGDFLPMEKWQCTK